MIISKIEVKGEGKKTASVGLKKGLNTIVGATNTGKSYVCECLQFIFGAEESPKPIDEAKGYTSLEVVFIDNDDTPFTLKRELKNGSDIILEADGASKVLKPNLQGSNKRKPNISSFFLSKLELDKNTLAKGLKNLTHSSLSLRILEKIFLVDEERVIGKHSPLGTGNSVDTTLEYSLLKTLLSGSDDSEILKLKERKNSKSSLKQKIGHLNEFANDFIPPEKNTKVSLSELKDSSEKLTSAILDTQKLLEDHVSENKDLIGQRNDLQTRVSDLNSQLSEDNTVLERFSLLLEKYASDQERLEANSEAMSYLVKHHISQCPTCGHPLSDTEVIEDEAIIKSNAAEIAKTKGKVADLNSTIRNIEQHQSSTAEQLDKAETHLSKVNDHLNGEIIEKIRKYSETVKVLSDKRAEVEADISNKETRTKVHTEMGSLQAEHDKILDKYEIPDFSTELKKLNDEVSSVLTRWDFPEGKSVKFDKKTRDIVIGNKPRAHFGKGYRAISFASFLLGLMNVLAKKDRHPGFLIMDSPLTTYKKGDEKAPREESEQEHIANNLIYAFYRDLCDFYNDKQIIVLDNQEPDKDLINKMNYIHFSGNKEIGRPGFFPVSS